MTARVAETDELREAVDVADRLLENIETVVHGKRDEIRLVLTALACNGHVLFEDVPGTAKTVLARAVSQSIEGAVGTRIQCTPDLQPTDVTGLAVYDQRIRDFEFRPGPIFANVVLVDEINRAMPKTQSALLEAMAERQVTVDGTTRAVPRPFLLLATENPIEYEGTFPLPEAQLDRFFLRTSLGYPSADEELQVIGDRKWVRLIVEDHGAGIPAGVLPRIFDPFFTTKGRDQGTGLGLAVSHGLANDNDGELGVETRVGHGTRFYLDLPSLGV